MTRLYDDPTTFTDDALAGFLDAHADAVMGVPGGVVRAGETPVGKVAVVVGGGSGHDPAFCGLVGRGLADGAVVGNVFTSPSAEEAYSVVRAVSGGGGALLMAGNYAGDVMNFRLAQQRLAEEGIDTRLLFVTDDMASAGPDEAKSRRGIAGDFVVFKVAGAAAERGDGLDEVERLARLANERTRTLGVAFAGCTLPGGDAPLLTVPAGAMGVGLGIHGEPGLSEEQLPSAADLATRLVEGVLREAPADPGQRRVGVVLNGLGSTKYEELFVVWRTVATELADRGFTVVEPEVGELVTSLDMAGCSLTLVFLDDELEPLWCAPTYTPAYRKEGAEGSGWEPAAPARRRATTAEGSAASAAVGWTPGSAASQACARTSLRALTAMASALRDAEAELGRIDAVAGDGDHGRGMVKGVTAALDAAGSGVDAGAGAGSVLAAAGDAWAAQAGGTSGVLYGALLREVGTRLGDQADHESEPAEVVGALRAGLDGVTRLGGAKVGDKTMLDALVPFVDTFEQRVSDGAGVAKAWTDATTVAEEAAKESADMRPRIGRARPLADRSVGTPDAGAVSLSLCVRAIAGVLSGHNAGTA